MNATTYWTSVDKLGEYDIKQLSLYTFNIPRVGFEIILNCIHKHDERQIYILSISCNVFFFLTDLNFISNCRYELDQSFINLSIRS